MTIPINFFVPGRPIAQGSKAFKGLANRRGVMVESAKQLGPWRERIAIAAHNYITDTARNNQLPFNGQPLSAKLVFVMPRPASTPKMRTPPAIRRPDLDKMVRAVFDALTGIIYSDDAAITCLETFKRIADLNESPGVHITIRATQ